MKFLYEDLNDSILVGSDYEEKDLFIEEEGDWIADGKYQYRDIVFKHNGKHYIIAETRSGSPFSEYHYEEHDIDKDGYVECEEVFKKKTIITEWHTENTKTDVDELEERLSEAESLLYDARCLLNNIHGYDTETYRNICNYLDGEDEE